MTFMLAFDHFVVFYIDKSILTACSTVNLFKLFPLLHHCTVLLLTYCMFTAISDKVAKFNLLKTIHQWAPREHKCQIA